MIFFKYFMSATYDYVFDIFLKIIFQNTKKLPFTISEIQKNRRNGLKIEFHNVKKLHQKYFGQPPQNKTRQTLRFLGHDWICHRFILTHDFWHFDQLGSPLITFHKKILGRCLLEFPEQLAEQHFEITITFCSGRPEELPLEDFSILKFWKW
jgi:hypothetical protein